MINYRRIENLSQSQLRLVRPENVFLPQFIAKLHFSAVKTFPITPA